ncbi:BatA domain-containing protein [Hymenobacter sp. BT175]|uniref:BatA domain-containing protein n=1 Tax=Hymenobacter translucens TaxID=2886507 RepID=UPI001D0EA453|nr:BatA domain-containing protein [Hymenobacter translucens]MCC2546813.1 BatA domain-containing protein [Hymenobacter translucens]
MSLTYPWFLLGLLSLAIPIALHFFELRRPQRVLFTNVGFIREVKLVTARQRRLKHLLVLLARLGALTFLVLAFCLPFIPAPLQNEQAGGHTAVVLDSSPSMEVENETGQPIFEQAQQEARSLVRAMPASARFRIAGSGRESVSGAAYQATIDEMRVSGHSGSLRADLNKVQAGRQPGQVFIFSDFQKNSFSPQLLEEIDKEQEVFLVPLGVKAAQNVYVDSVALEDAFVRTGADLTLRVRLRNGGSAPAADCQVKLFVEGRQEASFRTSVAAGSTSTSTVQVRLTSDQIQKCRVEVTDLPVSFDNTYYFTLQPSPKIRIVGVAGRQEAAVAGVYTNEPLFAYTGSRAGRVDYQQLASANLAVVEEVERVDAGLRENLRRLVQQGGTVVVVPPAGAAARESYNQLFRELGVGTVQWQPTGTPVLRDIAAPSRQNPFFQDVFAEQNPRTVMPKASPVLQWSRSGTEILRMRDGDSYLAGFTSGRGMVYLFAAPFGGGYSDFPTQALFVPVLYRLAMQSYRNDQQPAYRLNQRAISLTVPATASAEQVFKLQKDSLAFIPAQRTQAGRVVFDVPPGAEQPGFYTLSHNGRPVTTLALNFDKRESQLASYSAAELRQLIGSSRPNVHVYEPGNGATVAARYRAERVGTPLWRYCIWAALACLLAEVLLLRFGNRKAAAAPVNVAA